MRVPSDPGTVQPPSKPEPAQTQQSKSFDQVLERKSEDRGPKKARGMKDPKPDDPDGRNAAMPDSTALLLPLGGSGPAEAARAGGAPDLRALEGLVREIHVVAGANPKVELQFHSTTLQGLNVRIERRGDQVSIRFLTGSDSVAQLLSKNAGQLSQALQARGVQVATVKVELTTPSAPSSDSGRPSRDGQRGERDPRQDRRQR